MSRSGSSWLGSGSSRDPGGRRYRVALSGSTRVKPIRAGLVGAGPWADMIHAPGLAGHDGIRFTHLWARNAGAAQAIADRYGLSVCTDHAELLGQVDLVSYSVPPDVQAPLATDARAAGKLVLLEKPVARSAADASRLAQASAVRPAVVNYSRLLDAAAQRWIADQRDTGWASARIIITNGATLPDNPFGRSPWRHEHDASLWDLGPHALSLLAATLGPVADVKASRSGDLLRLLARHLRGGQGEVLCSVAAKDEESYDFVTSKGATLRLPEEFDPAGAFRRALDVVLYGASGPGDLAASDLRFSTHIVDILEAAAMALADGKRHAAGASAFDSAR